MKLGATDQVGENFFRALLRPLWRDQEREVEERAEAPLERFNLAHMRNEFAGTLSGGQRKLLEMARALMVQPQLVMLDEPMAGVNPALAQSIIGHVEGLRDEGLTVLFIEHDMDVVRTISDWVVVMAEGLLIAEGRHSSIVTNPRVIDAYLGAHHGTPLDRAEQEKQLAEAQQAIEAEEQVREEAQ
jgi:neutral amino acid transport system ATP-binding protein